jgi:Leucine-rich repeat (LRR) protein
LNQSRFDFLNLGFNGLTRIEPGAFQHFKSLAKLHLFNNKLSRIESRTLQGLAGLKLLRLDSNEIELIESNSFRDTTHLEYLYLELNRLYEIQAFGFACLSSLYSAPVDLSTLIAPFAFSDLRYQDKLYLSFNKLTHIGFHLQRHARVELLRLENNFIKKIDLKAFESLTKLKMLSLNNNRLKSLEFLHSLSSLLFLNLSQNAIRSLNESDFHTASSLRTLDLSSNLLEFLPAAVSHAMTQTLVELRLTSNNLQIVKETYFKCLKFLRRLLLSDNKISSVDSRAFRDLTALTYLDLSGNSLVRLDERVFWSLKNFVKLNLSLNELFEVRSGLYRPMVRLLDLDLSFNRIRVLPGHAFGSNLTRLDLAFNKLVVLETNSFHPMAKAFHLSLRGTPMITSLNRTTRKIKLVGLDLSHNVNLMAERADFSHLVDLSVLDLENTSQSLIQAFRFDGFKGLAALSLNYNEIGRAVSFANFSELNKFQKLKMRKIGNFSLEILNEMNAKLLSEVDLSENAHLDFSRLKFFAKIAEFSID